MKIVNSVLVLVLALALPALALAKPVTVQVKGMVCAFCAQGIEKKFKSRPDVSSVKVSLETKKVDLDFKDGHEMPDADITKIINDAGYDVVKIERSK